MDLQANEFRPEDYYLAQLTAVLANCHRGKGQAPWSTKDFLIQFKLKDSEESKAVTTPLTPEQKKKHIDQSKAMWFAALGLDKDGKPYGGKLRKRHPPRKPRRKPDR